MVQSKGVLERKVMGRVTMPRNIILSDRQAYYKVIILITTKKYINLSSTTSHQGLGIMKILYKVVSTTVYKIPECFISLTVSHDSLAKVPC